MKLRKKLALMAVLGSMLAIATPAHAVRCVPYGYTWLEWFSPAWLLIHAAANAASRCTR